MVTQSLGNKGARALGLLEMIGVIAVLATLAAVLAPILVRQMDRVAGDQENTALKSLADALQQSIVRNRYIPSHTDWTNVLGVELGMNPSGVAVNARKQPRFFLIDPNLRIGTNTGFGLPYRQDGRGSTNPVSPRLLIVSSISQPLTNMTSGTPSSSDFNAIWDWSESSASPPAPLAYLKRASDLRVQRLNLSPLFVRLILTTNNSADIGKFAISTNALNWQTNIVPVNPGIDGYFITSSVLGLYTTNGAVLDSQQILNRDSSFAYEQGVWRNSIYGPPPGSGGSGGLTGVMGSAYSIVTNFLAAPPNPDPSASNQASLVQTMVDYMNAYDAWAGLNFTNNPAGNTAYSNAVAKQQLMISTLNGLIINLPPP